MINILEHAKELVDSGLRDLVAKNENIKQEKSKLKKRTEEEQVKRGLRRG